MEEQVLETGGKKMREELTKGKVRRKYTSERKYSFLLRGSDYPMCILYIRCIHADGLHGIFVWGYFFSWWLGGMLETSERNNSFWANYPWHGIVSGLLVSDSWTFEKATKFWGEDSESPKGNGLIWQVFLWLEIRRVSSVFSSLFCDKMIFFASWERNYWNNHQSAE